MSKTICLVRPLTSPIEISGIPLNLLILASALKKYEYDVVIKDYDFLKEVDLSWKSGVNFAKRAAEDIESLGCSYVAITSMCSNYVLAVELAKEIKNINSDVHVILGGPQATMCAKETLEIYPDVDTIIIGEGEVTLPELINAIEKGESLSNIKGIGYINRNNDVVINEKRPLLKDLDSSPIPAYELIDIKKYIKIKDTISIYIGSGCPFDCNFCTTSLVWERKYRVKTINRILKEIELLINNYGVTKFDFIHDNLTSNKKFIIELLHAIKKKNWDIIFEFSSRIDSIDEEIIQLAAEVGCIKVFFGIETASERMQKQIGKKLHIDNIQRIIACCLENGIFPNTSFIIGFPEENIEELGMTIKMAFRIKVQVNELVCFNLLSVYTGSKLLKEQCDNLIFDKKSLESSMTYFLNDNHLEQISKNKFIYPNYYSFEQVNSGLTRKELVLLLEFVTIFIEKYPYTINILSNDLEISIIKIFRIFKDYIDSLSIEEKDMLKVNLTEEDIYMLMKLCNIDKKYEKYVVDAYKYDNILNNLYNGVKVDQVLENNNFIVNLKNWELYKGNLKLFGDENSDFFNEKIISDNEYFYIVVKVENDLNLYEIEENQFNYLYELKNKSIILHEELKNKEIKKLMDDCIDINMFTIV